MNKWLKIISLGLLIWVIPFIASFFVWDMETNAATVSTGMFNALMAFFWSIGLAIAILTFFKGNMNTVKEGWRAGIAWYLIAVIMDLIILVGAFGMAFAEWSYMILTYLNTAILTIAVGYLLKK